MSTYAIASYIQGAAHGRRGPEDTTVEDVGVDLGGLDVFVTQQFLDGADVVASFQEVGGEAVA